MNETKSTPIALKLPKVVALLILQGRHIVQAMTNNPWFASLVALLTTTSADLDALQAAQVTALTRVKGAAAARNVKKKAVVDDLNALKAGVQLVMNQNPQQAAAIAESGAMSQKKVGVYWKPNLAGRMGPAAGEVLVRAKAVGRGASYEWQFSGDGKLWVAMGTTTVANTTVLGLTVGTTYLFRFRTTIGQTTSDWSQTVSFVVH